MATHCLPVEQVNTRLRKEFSRSLCNLLPADILWVIVGYIFMGELINLFTMSYYFARIILFTTCYYYARFNLIQRHYCYAGIQYFTTCYCFARINSFTICYYYINVTFIIL